MKYSMNIFDGKEGTFLGKMQANTLPECEVLSEIELDVNNAVEVYETATDFPVSNYNGKLLKTDSDGFFSRIKH